MIKTHPQLPETGAQHHQVTVPSSVKASAASPQQLWVFQWAVPLSYQPRSLKTVVGSSCPSLPLQVTALPQPLRSAASSASLICPCSLSSDRKLPLSFPSQEISCGEALKKQTKSSLVQKKREHAHSCEENTKCWSSRGEGTGSRPKLCEEHQATWETQKFPGDTTVVKSGSQGWSLNVTVRFYLTSLKSQQP